MKRSRSVRRLRPLLRHTLTVVSLMMVMTGRLWAETESGPGQLEIFRSVPYAERGSTHLHADVYVPAGSGPFPGVLMVHGGGWVSGYREQMSHHARILAQNGLVVVAISYRLAPRFRFPAQLLDCQDALRWMARHAARYRMDAKRLAGFGYSAGAQLICVLGFDARQVDRQAVAAGPTPPQLQAVVAGGTPCDLAQGTRCGLLRYVYLGGTPEQHPERYRQASPVTYLSASCPPTFFYHGTVDRMVGANGVLAVSRRLQELGVRCEVYRVPGKGHIAAFGDDTAIQKAADFLNDVLEPTAETTPGNSEEPK